MKIFLAAGHGGNDPGAVANNTTERDEAIKIIDQCAALLAPIVKPPRQLIIVPHDLSLIPAVKYINSKTGWINKNICIELHFNSNFGSPGTGTETFYGYPKLAQMLQRNLVQTLGLKDRGAKAGNHLFFNKATRPGSAIVEIGFINDYGDLSRIRQSGALALARGVAEFIGIQLTGPPVPQTPTINWEAKYKRLSEALLKTVRDYVAV